MHSNSRTGRSIIRLELPLLLQRAIMPLGSLLRWARSRAHLARLLLLQHLLASLLSKEGLVLANRRRYQIHSGSRQRLDLASLPRWEVRRLSVVLHNNLL